ncbi:hypothetical protein KDA_46200 [Dictyobacter alpinus]|uniref:Uncharacterized protein n=1 Tax=Dictyobacter alpinus TaxID=2014873 RepID=A0A402BCR9_9CHLR|nr:hypothetical protein [Dictyobacter alpinus]GCE29136.1 hypothetical protein KDA_46200 [Dictyobacter alpinus]
MWRHGDVLIEQVAELPVAATRTQSSILAHGEITGHSHRLETPENAVLWTTREMLFLQVIHTVRIIHEEHKPITLEPGTYRVWKQREYTPQAIKYVRD